MVHKAISTYVIIKNEPVLPKNVMHEMNDRHMTYVIGSNINNRLSISCNTGTLILP